MIASVILCSSYKYPVTYVTHKVFASYFFSANENSSEHAKASAFGCHQATTLRLKAGLDQRVLMERNGPSHAQSFL